jgi:hypothetical protein
VLVVHLDSAHGDDYAAHAQGYVTLVDLKYAAPLLRIAFNERTEGRSVPGYKPGVGQVSILLEVAKFSAEGLVLNRIASDLPLGAPSAKVAGLGFGP